MAALLNVLFPGLGFLYAGATRHVGLGAVLPLVGATAGALAVLFLPPSIFAVLLFIGAQLFALLLLGILGWRSAATAPVPFTPGRLNRRYWYWGFAAAVTWGYVAGVRPWLRANLLAAYRIPSESMSPTLVVGDFVVVDRRSAFQGRAATDQLVVFRSPDEPTLEVLKRVAGAPGDTLEMRGGILYRDGYPDRRFFHESDVPAPLTPDQLRMMREWQVKHFVGPVPADYTPDPLNWGPIDVPAHFFFALGDDRAHSWDSRYYGLVPIDRVLGRPRLIYWNSSYLLPGMFARVGTEPK